MLSIKNLKSGHAGGAAGVANYCEHRSRANGVGYYSGGAPSAWHGAGAEALGLEGPVNRDDLVRVLEGQLPDGTDLTTRGNREHDRRLGKNLQPPSVMSCVECRIKALEFDARILRRELPVHFGMNLIAARLPCSNLSA